MAEFLAAEQLKDLIVLFKKNKTTRGGKGSAPYIIEPFSSSMKEDIIEYYIIPLIRKIIILYYNII